ncbi:f-box domain-containing protein [Colletotrichum incanum]|uniref:F-box domain-containing protein n=1 Tax=Colletotrichum incanum TaxID=1573173 RepID=A0A162Q9R1_COLIC|nr:f-box domain-containing protein [Colletotrichum incanum]OHW97447.1 F-box domain-containing protein [Colletotrichum incanum]
MSGSTMPVQHLAQPISPFSEPLFAKLPAEIQLEILSYCQQNDLVCLSLASHFFRTITLFLIPKKPSLQSYDQNLPPEALFCTCGNDRPVGVELNIYAHRRGRHNYIVKHTARGMQDNGTCSNWSPCRAYPPQHAVCQRQWCKHCTCISCPLYVRLRGWMGEDLRYCSVCRKFTNRAWTKKYHGRCLHGRPKVRRSSNNRWTTVKGKSYGDRWWNRWGTSGVDSWGYDERYVRGDSMSLSRRRNARIV